MGRERSTQSSLAAIAATIPLALAAACSSPSTDVGGFDAAVAVDAAPSRAPSRLPAVSGGTLTLVGRNLLLASVPELASAVLVSLSSTEARIRHWIPFGPDDEPGRVVGISDTEAAVVLRNASAVAIIDLTTGRETRRIPTCTQPRGLDLAGPPNVLWVACADGHLQRFAAPDWTRVSDLFVAEDLRDVVVHQPDLATVTTFRSARQYSVNFTGSAAVTELTGGPGPNGYRHRVAWRARKGPTGGTRVVSQVHGTAPIDVSASRPTPYGIQLDLALIRSAWQNNFSADRTPPTIRDVGSRGTTATLPVDFACAPAASACVIAAAGDRWVYRGSTDETRPMVAWQLVPGSARAAMPVAVEFVDSRTVAVQTRDPSRLAFFRIADTDLLPPPLPLDLADLGEQELGPRLFHALTSSGLTCASCHPEGEDDGHVWQFRPDGPRRTIRIPRGVLATAPFHWSGDLPSFSALASEVFVRRMGGTALSATELNALGNWLDARPAVRNELPEPTQAATIARGQALYRGVGRCAECHLESSTVAEASFDIGTGGALQAPPLAEVRWRAPYMHNGCAATLEQRFEDGACGGRWHGGTLTREQQADLIAYLRTL